MGKTLFEQSSIRIYEGQPEYYQRLPQVMDISEAEEIQIEMGILGDELLDLEVALYPLLIARLDFSFREGKYCDFRKRIP